ncbi:MAG: DUF1080 domain-containing protein [Candidatus Azobacteroides sp.]|nr:DUF1080 domain-containing protein [Candidatus Azobacteroides sp.]
MKNLLSGFLILCLFVSCHQQRSNAYTEEEEWIPLFNGRDLSGWTVKIKGYPAGENAKNTFRVEDGILKVSYEEYGDIFNNSFGHIFTDQPYSDYKLKVEYRFVGEQLSDAPEWAYRNSGIMFHAQSPGSMALNQDFPISIEAQLLGGDGLQDRPNGNVCTPGTEIYIQGNPYPEHCYSSSSRTYHGDDWVTFEMVVFSDSIVHHIMEGDTILTYTRLSLTPDNPELPEGMVAGPLKQGYIVLQSEGHPVEFRKVELVNFENKGKGKK